MNYLAIIGLISFVVMVILLIKGPFSPVPVFILVPVIGGLIAGYSPREISNFAKEGFSSVQTSVIVTAFAILFFSIMSDVGMFEVIIKPVIKKVGKSRNPVIAITMAAALVSSIGHLDGAGVTTIMITFPLMIPFFDKLKMDRKALGLSMAVCVGAMNLVPWTGPTRNTAIVLGIDPVELWRYIIPAQITMIVIGFIIAFLLGRREIKRGAVNSISELPIDEAATESPCVKNRLAFLFNLFLTIALLALLVMGLMNSGFTFMIFTAAALIFNYRTKKLQAKKIKQFSPDILNMVLNVLGVGVLIGIMQEGGFVDALANSVFNVLPEFVGPFVHLIIAVFAMPLLMMLGTGPYYQGLMPIVVGICTQFGVNPVLAACVILVPSGVSVAMCPLVAANHVSCGMLGYEMGDAIKYGWKWILAAALAAIPVTMASVSFLL
jgi:CitMHS family citrate-Mg2+:H+ or citrate-Ca2+:H+ symporter